MPTPPKTPNISPERPPACLTLSPWCRVRKAGTNVLNAYMSKLWIVPETTIHTSVGVRASDTSDADRRRAPTGCGSEAPRAGSGSERQSAATARPGTPAARKAARHPHACAMAPPTA